jgi:tRNA pseudouridine38-40 synthase
MKKVALKVAYIGTNFHGFQRQPNHRTVEGEIIYALKKADYVEDLKKSYFSIAGRTDRGVHALGNVISFMSEKEVIINQINDHLPADIQILAKVPVHYGFKPRYALKRHYKYIISENTNKYPLLWELDMPADNEFDLEKMMEAASYFEGTHNFINFSKRSERNPLRTVDEVKVSKNGEVIVIDVVGESFLWNMVRKMVKTILEVGNGKIKPLDIIEMLNPENNIPLKPMVPENLILMDVIYKNLNFTYDNYACYRFQSTLKDELFKHKSATLLEETMINDLDYLKQK